MALTLNATAGHASANSYATVAEANTYHEAHLYASTWNDAVNDPTKAQALVMATRLLDHHFQWYGSRATQAQKLKWPRLNAYDADGYILSGSTIPALLQDATAELARLLIDSDRTAESDTSSGEIAEATVGPLKVKYVEGSATAVAVIPAHVVTMLMPLGVYKSGTGGAISMSRG